MWVDSTQEMMIGGARMALARFSLACHGVAVSDEAPPMAAQKRWPQIDPWAALSAAILGASSCVSLWVVWYVASAMGVA